jgi:hypothetical protein
MQWVPWTKCAFCPLLAVSCGDTGLGLFTLTVSSPRMDCREVQSRRAGYEWREDKESRFLRQGILWTTECAYMLLSTSISKLVSNQIMKRSLKFSASSYAEVGFLNRPTDHLYWGSVADPVLRQTVGSKVKENPCYRPWRLLGLREVETPTLLRQTANRWRPGCQPYAPADLYPQVSFLRFLVLISVRGWVDSSAIVQPEGLGKLEKNPPHRKAISR